jgi:mRNA interferase RelE/StbE
MTFVVVWQPAAVAGLRRVGADDAVAAKGIMAAVATLSAEPRPSDSSPLGDLGLRRLRIGEARVLYEVEDTDMAVHILTVGRTPAC